MLQNKSMFKEGQQIGPYTLVSKLGKGGFGEVWLAEKRSQFLTKRVAVKLPHDEQVNFDTIKREAMLWEEASGHPNVLPIIDADVYDGQVVIVSEYADGGSLADRLNSVSTTTVKNAAELTIGILSGLDYLHGKRIIHRDIKPQNILIQGGTPRLADFGISRAMQTTAVSSTIIGTDAYMSPEAFDGKRTVQTDVWSVGVVLYQLLNGTLPFPQEHPSERMFAVLTKDFAPLAPDIPPDLRAIVEKALQKMPEDRYGSAAAMRDDLSRALNRLNNPTFVKTEVLDAASMATEVSQPSDPDATVVRTAGPAVAVPFVADDSVVTRVEVNIPKAKQPWPNSGQTFGETGITAYVSDMSTGRIVIVAAMILFALMFLSAIISKLTRGTRSSVPNVNIPLSNSANVTRPPAMPTNSYSSMNTTTTNSTYPSNMSSSSSSSSPFCRGYVDGWNEGYDSVRSTKNRVDIPCPDEKNYPDKSYEGGRLTGYWQGMQVAKGANSP